MTTPRAADLPVGSVVVTAATDLIKMSPAGECWRTCTGEPAGATNDEVDTYLAGGAKVSRTGWCFE